MQQFSWHANINALLELPPEIKQSICAEYLSEKCLKLAHNQSNHKKRISQETYLQGSALESNLPFNSKSHKYSMEQSSLLQDSPLIVSFGNDWADHLSMISNNSRTVKLLTWTGLSTT